MQLDDCTLAYVPQRSEGRFRRNRVHPPGGAKKKVSPKGLAFSFALSRGHDATRGGSTRRGRSLSSKKRPSDTKVGAFWSIGELITAAKLDRGASCFSSALVFDADTGGLSLGSLKRRGASMLARQPDVWQTLLFLSIL